MPLSSLAQTSTCIAADFELRPYRSMSDPARTAADAASIVGHVHELPGARLPFFRLLDLRVVEQRRWRADAVLLGDATQSSRLLRLRRRQARRARSSASRQARPRVLSARPTGRARRTNPSASRRATPGLSSRIAVGRRAARLGNRARPSPDPRAPSRRSPRGCGVIVMPYLVRLLAISAAAISCGTYSRVSFADSPSRRVREQVVAAGALEIAGVARVRPRAMRPRPPLYAAAAADKRAGGRAVP